MTDRALKVAPRALLRPHPAGIGSTISNHHLVVPPPFCCLPPSSFLFSLSLSLSFSFLLLAITHFLCAMHIMASLSLIDPKVSDE